MERRSNAPLWASLRVGLQPGRGITLAEINTLLDALGLSRVLTSYNSFTRARSRALGHPTRSSTYGGTKDAWKRQLREELTAWGLWDLEPAELSKALGTLVIESAQDSLKTLGMGRTTPRLQASRDKGSRSPESTRNSQQLKPRLAPRLAAREGSIGSTQQLNRELARGAELNRLTRESRDEPPNAPGISFSDSPFETVDFEFDDIEWDTRFTPYYDYGFGHGYGPDYDWDLD